MAIGKYDNQVVAGHKLEVGMYWCFSYFLYDCGRLFLTKIFRKTIKKMSRAKVVIKRLPGLTKYTDALKLQHSLQEEVRNNPSKSDAGYALLLEHTPVYRLGRCDVILGEIIDVIPGEVLESSHTSPHNRQQKIRIRRWFHKWPQIPH